MKKKRPLLFEALSQVVIKPRGILKMSQAWLPLSLILLTGTGLDPRAQLSVSLFLLYAVLSKGLSSILINDLTDREIDRSAGKERWITSLPPPAGILIPVVLLASGFLALLKAGGGLLVLASFTATALLGILYSLKPVRFKERGVLGIAAYSLSAAILNVLVPWALFRPALVLLPLLFVVVLPEKLVQILFHQINDFDSDSAEKVRSFAVVTGRAKAERGLHIVLNIAVAADLLLLFCILFVSKEKPLIFSLVSLASLIGISTSAIYVKVVSKKLKTSTALTELLPWPYLGLSYVLFYVIPPLLFLALAMSEPEMWVLAALSALSLLGVSVNYFFYSPKK